MDLLKQVLTQLLLYYTPSSTSWHAHPGGAPFASTLSIPTLMAEIGDPRGGIVGAWVCVI